MANDFEVPGVSDLLEPTSGAGHCLVGSTSLPLLVLRRSHIEHRTIGTTFPLLNRGPASGEGRPVFTYTWYPIDRAHGMRPLPTHELDPHVQKNRNIPPVRAD